VEQICIVNVIVFQGVTLFCSVISCHAWTYKFLALQKTCSCGLGFFQLFVSTDRGKSNGNTLSNISSIL